MPRKAGQSIPKHRGSGQAVVTIQGRDHYYLGPHGTKASKLGYDRLIAEWLASGRSTTYGKPDAPLTVALVVWDYLAYAKRYDSPTGGPWLGSSSLPAAPREVCNLRLGDIGRSGEVCNAALRKHVDSTLKRPSRFGAVSDQRNLYAFQTVDGFQLPIWQESHISDISISLGAALLEKTGKPNRVLSIAIHAPKNVPIAP
jgi:hypothetical protein